MDDYKVVLGAVLKANAKNDIQGELENLKDLSIIISKATLSPSAINDIRTQLSKNGIDLNLVFGNKEQIINEAKKTGERVGQQINQGISKGGKSSVDLLENFKSSLRNIGMGSDEIEAVANRIESLGVDLKGLNQSISETEGKKGAKRILSVDIIGTDEFGQAIKITEQYNAETGKLVKSINAVSTAQEKAASASKATANTFDKQKNQAVTNLTNQIDRLNRAAKDPNASRPISDETNLKKISEAYNEIIAAIERMKTASSSTFSDEQNNVKTLISNFQSLISEIRNAENVSVTMKGVDLTSGIEIAKNNLAKFKAEAKNFPQIAQTVRELDSAISNIGDAASLNNFNNQLKVARSELGKIKAESKTSSDNSFVGQNKIDSLLQRYQVFYDKNTAAHRKYGKVLRETMVELSSSSEMTQERFQQLSKQLTTIQNQARQTGRLGLSFFDSIKAQVAKFTQWFSVADVVMRGVQTIKEVIDNVKELDNSLLELAKVSDLSSSGLKDVTEKAYELGGRVARTGREVIDATTEFKRAGYDMQDSMDMAESAMVMTNVAENITDTADAAGTLISVLKGFNMDASKTMDIVDKINSVSNQSPISFDNIAEGLERTSGTLAQSGTTIDETIGLITAGYAQLRNVEKVSTSLITLSARLRGVDEDGEKIDGLSAKLQSDFGKIGVAIEGADGNLRSIYDIMQDYSKVLPTLTDKQKQYYAELAAGYSIVNRVSSNVQKCA